MTVLSQLLQHRIVAIIRGARPDDVLPIATALYEGGIRAVEITLNSERALEAIAAVAAVMGQQLLVGAGTVLDAATARQAIERGARFIISPSLDIDTIKATKEEGAVSIPGAYTATEIVTAHKAGADIIKVFPASSPQYIKDLYGPLSHIPLMPTGGVDLGNIGEYQQAGAVAFGIGSALVNTKQAATADYLQALKEKAGRFVKAIK